MEGGKAELDHHQQGHVAPHVNQLHQEAWHNGQEVADGKEKTCLSTVSKTTCYGVDMKGAKFRRHRDTQRYHIGTQSQEGWDGEGQENGSNLNRRVETSSEGAGYAIRFFQSLLRAETTN